MQSGRIHHRYFIDLMICLNRGFGIDLQRLRGLCPLMLAAHSPQLLRALFYRGRWTEVAATLTLDSQLKNINMPIAYWVH